MSQRRRGAVRSEAARVAILRATAHLFQASGYDNLAMESIAAEAGVAKQTIYRWWPSKSALVAECLLEGLLMPDLGLPDTGDVKADLVAWTDRIFAILREPSGESLVRSLIAAATENADIGRRLHDSLGTESSVTGRLADAVEAGQLRDGSRLQEIAEALVGAVLLRALGRIPIAAGDAERLVDTVLGGALAR